MSSEARHPRDGADQDPRSARPSLLECWGILNRDQHLAAIAAALLFATMLLPWYQQNAVVSAAKTQPLVSRNLNAFAVFSFVEAAVLLVAVAVLALLYARAVGRAFQLPGGDGAVVFAAGIWTALLLVLRLFDKPGITHNGVAANVGIQWGIFFALAAAGLLAYSGSRMRAARRPDPPLLRHEPRARRGTRGEDQARRRAPGEERTEIVGRDERHLQRTERQTVRTDRDEVLDATEIVARRQRGPAASPVPARQRAPHEPAPASAPASAPPSAPAPEPPFAPAPEPPLAPGPEPPSAPASATERPRYPPAPSRSRAARAQGSAPEAMDQLSFEDAEPGA